MRVGVGSLIVMMALFAAVVPGMPRAAVAIHVSPNANLAFGQVVATITPGMVTVSPTSSRTRTGGVILGNAFGVMAASFTVTGDPDASYSIMLPSSCALTAGGASMTVDAFTSSPSGAGNLGPGGSQVVSVGATLHVGAPQVSAAYSGTYVVTVAYD